ncbi:tetratricopeptide repeat protein [Nannocystis bainbridge]|uniref:Tetratricopeptide repeat protein n=1 Tax=Nannocystis bainbridge TaxID=2995303 RepID=A0ABT5EB23_9BACT|nr:tetratricopeptide repeat protein [Nannocystis bainbridge]MDC0723068.1 tetratricopeptide repeat protein [Nannocystis bainbridge]
MSGDPKDPDYDDTEAALEPGELMFDDGDEDEVAASEEEIQEAAQAIELVTLPVSCTNEGKGAPLGMGIQRFWAQELAEAGVRAAAPVFTAIQEQEGRRAPALMIFREPWTDERALEGINRFANAKFGLATDMFAQEEKVTLTARLVAIRPGPALETVDTFVAETTAEQLPGEVFVLTQKIAAALGKQVEKKTWQEAFGTENVQAIISFLVGLGNLSALQGRCVPTTSDQLLSPLMDALGRAPEMDVTMQALHAMTDILIAGQPDQAAIPLSVQALSIAAQKRKNDQGAWHHLALVLRRVGDLGSAVQAFQQAINLGPQNAAVAAGFVDTLRAAGDLENALKVAQFAVENGNEGVLLMAQLGSLLIENDQFDEAEPFLRRAVEEGKVPSAYGDLANVLWETTEDDPKKVQEDRDEALALLAQAIEQPTLHKSALDILLDLHEEEKLEKATLLMLRAAEKHAENATVLRYVASMYLEGDEPARARPYLDSILKLQRRSLDDDAFARRAILTLDVEGFEDRYDQAIDYVRSGDPQKHLAAAKFLREMIGRDPRYWQPHLMLALAVRDSEGDASALSHLNDAVRLRPNDAEIRNLMSAILRKQGRAREAVEHLRAVVAINPREIEPVVNLASAMRDANMFDEARQVCTAALQMIPDHPEFKRILDSLPPPRQRQN